ncbi:MAG: PfkB family carbohydrate kinase [Chloroflexi bacterium]|nr:PfkB family carbohydrate kinase [Chloroflexota bacterium]
MTHTSVVSTPSPTYLTVGHVTRDLHPTRWEFGGTAYYSSLAAQRLGMRVTALTRAAAADAHALASTRSGIRWIARAASATTAMRNTYGLRGRTQHAPEVAAPFDVADLKDLPHEFSVVHLAPVVAEIGPELLGHLPRADVTGLTAQGLLRRVAPNGAVHGRDWTDAVEFLDAIDVLVLSSEDIAFDPTSGIERLRRAAVGVLTRGPLPVQVFADGGSSEIPVRQVADASPTGAGDVFAAALFVGLQRSGRLGEAVQTAARVATGWVERRWEALPPTPPDPEIPAPDQR